MRCDIWGSNLSDVTAACAQQEQRCLVNNGSLKLICFRWPGRKRTQSPLTIADIILCGRGTVHPTWGSDRAIIPFIFVLLSTGIRHLDEPAGGAEISLKTATKTSLCPSPSLKWREEQQAQWKKCKPQCKPWKGLKGHFEYCLSTTLYILICHYDLENGDYLCFSHYCKTFSLYHCDPLEGRRDTEDSKRRGGMSFASVHKSLISFTKNILLMDDKIQIFSHFFGTTVHSDHFSDCKSCQTRWS